MLLQTCYVVRPLPYGKRILYVVGEAFCLPRGHKVTFVPERVAEDVDPYNLKMNIDKIGGVPIKNTDTPPTIF